MKEKLQVTPVLFSTGRNPFQLHIGLHESNPATEELNWTQSESDTKDTAELLEMQC